jgi:hypothetical protein
MNQPPETNDCLVKFLRQNRPEIPPASPDLEAQILGAISREQAQARGRKSRRVFWLISSSIAASAALTFWGIKPWINSPMPAGELAQMEAFMEYTWNGLLEDEMLDPATDWLFVHEENP